MSSDSRFPVDPDTHLPSMQSFDQLGEALRSMSSDPASVAVTQGMGELAKAIESVANGLSAQETGQTLGPKLVDLLTALRKHRTQVVGLGAGWRGLYEYASYLAALNNFRLLVGQWLVDRNIHGSQAFVLDDFEMIGWRTLGEGMLMIDMYEQARASTLQDSVLAPLDEAHMARAKSWWEKLKGG
jgi:hypothetical protein